MVVLRAKGSLELAIPRAEMEQAAHPELLVGVEYDAGYEPLGFRVVGFDLRSELGLVGPRGTHRVEGVVRMWWSPRARPYAQAIREPDPVPVETVSTDPGRDYLNWASQV